jgi:hypothetical protein
MKSKVTYNGASGISIFQMSQVRQFDRPELHQSLAAVAKVTLRGLPRLFDAVLVPALR